MTKDLTSGSPLKVILLFALPLVLGNLFQQFYSLADTHHRGPLCGCERTGVRRLHQFHQLYDHWLCHRCLQRLCHPYRPVLRRPGTIRICVGTLQTPPWLCIFSARRLSRWPRCWLTRPILQLMQTPSDIIDGAATYIGWIFAGIPFVFFVQYGGMHHACPGRQPDPR